jgi:hypothetical protein
MIISVELGWYKEGSDVVYFNVLFWYSYERVKEIEKTASTLEFFFFCC